MDTFVYEPIDLERPAFRLLQLLRGKGPTIECMLYQAYLDGTEIVPYNALSYTWGGTDRTSTVIVNGKTFGVTENLHSALRHLRSKHMDRVLWVDAICIDQGNERERGHQVQQMCKIYSQAEEVIVWLGQATKETDILMGSLQRLEEYSSIHEHRNWDLAQWTTHWQLVPRDRSFRLREGLDLLLRRPWFRRVWILQEIANAKRASVWCGIESVKARTFALAPLLIDIKPERHCQAVLDIMPGHLRENTWWAESRDLDNLLLKFRESEASDPRDKVYALLGISSDACDADILRPSYTKDLQTVIRDTSVFLFGQSHVSYETIPKLLEDLTSRNHTSFLELVRTSDVRAVERFLVRRGLEISPTEDMIKAATENTISGKDMIIFLLQKLGGQVKVTKEVLKEVQEAFDGDYEEILRILLERTADVDVRNRDSSKLLCMMLEVNYQAAVRLLLEKGVDPSRQGGYYDRAFHEALYRDQGEGVKFLLGNSAYANAKGQSFRKALCEASARGHEAVVKLLLDNGADPNARSGLFGTALHAASAGGYKAIVKQLLDKGADVNAKNSAFNTALYAASARGCEAVARLLLDRGADVNARCGSYETSLHAASARGHEAVVNLLLDRGADVNAVSWSFKTALYAASARGHEAVVKLLLGIGANVSVGGFSYEATLDIARVRGHTAVVKLLLSKEQKRPP